MRFSFTKTGKEKFFSKKRSWPNIIKLAAGIIIGGIGGYIYYLKVGCINGTCPITSNPWLSILWGIVIGYLFADLIPLRKPSG